VARRSAHPSARRRSRAAIVALSLLVLVGVPVIVVVVASRENPVQTAASAGRDPHHPSAPFFPDTGDGVRPDGIGCAGEGPVVLRGAAHLDVFENAAHVTVPAGIGVLPHCTYWLHTSAAGGTVTIASPQRRTFTLGDLFDIWGAPLTATRVLDFRVGAGRPLHAFVDGRPVSGDPRTIRLVDGREVALVVGRVPRTLPRRFRAAG
jgi:hypothetical protein